MKNVDGWLALVYPNTLMLASHFSHFPINTPIFEKNHGEK